MPNRLHSDFECCWTALTNGHIKYIWFVRTGQEQLFDLDADPTETNNLAGKPGYDEMLEKMRALMVEHLSERGEQWVKYGKLCIHSENILYGPNYPR